MPGFFLISSFVADYASKAWANSHLHRGESVEFIPHILRLTLTRNTGAAFGIGRENGAVMTTLAVVIVASICAWMLKREFSQNNKPVALERCGIAFILGGALGNLFDRFSRGEVTDFIEFGFIDFPVFNMADALIDLGAGLLIIAAFFSKERTGEAGESGSEEAASEEAASEEGSGPVNH